MFDGVRLSWILSGTHTFICYSWRRGIFKCVFLIPATLKVMGLIQKHFIRQHLLIQPNSSPVSVSSRSHSPFPLPIKTHTQTHFHSMVSSSNVPSPFVSQFRFRGKHKLIKWVSTLSCPPAAAFRVLSLFLALGVSHPPLCLCLRPPLPSYRHLPSLNHHDNS